MAAAKGPIYKSKNILCDGELADQLAEAVSRLVKEMESSVPIKRGQCEIGFGVSKTKRGIAADSVISIARAIKSLRGW